MTTGQLEMHRAIESMSPSATFDVNNRYQCRFDFTKRVDGTKLVSDWEADANCTARKTREASVLVYDTMHGTNLVGKIVLADNTDLSPSSRHMTSLYLASVGSSKWTACVPVSSINNMHSNGPAYDDAR